MKWRDWVEQQKDMAESMTTRLRGKRKLSRFVVYGDDGGRVQALAIPDTQFETAAKIHAVIDVFVVPLVLESKATRICWILNTEVMYMHDGGAVTVPECVVLCCFDREVEETWAAAVHRYGDATAIGIWQSWPSNATSTGLVAPIQSVIR